MSGRGFVRADFRSDYASHERERFARTWVACARSRESLEKRTCGSRCRRHDELLRTRRAVSAGTAGDKPIPRSARSILVRICAGFPTVAAILHLRDVTAWPTSSDSTCGGRRPGFSSSPLLPSSISTCSPHQTFEQASERVSECSPSKYRRCTRKRCRIV